MDKKIDSKLVYIFLCYDNGREFKLCIYFYILNNLFFLIWLCPMFSILLYYYIVCSEILETNKWYARLSSYLYYLMYEWHMDDIYWMYWWHILDVWMTYIWHEWCMGDIYLPYGWCMGDIYLAYGWHMDNIYFMYGWHVFDNIYLMYEWHILDMWMTYTWCMDDINLMYGWHTEAITISNEMDVDSGRCTCQVYAFP